MSNKSVVALLAVIVVLLAVIVVLLATLAGQNNQQIGQQQSTATTAALSTKQKETSDKCASEHPTAGGYGPFLKCMEDNGFAIPTPMRKQGS